MRTAVQRHGRALSWRVKAALVATAMIALVLLGNAVTGGGGVPRAGLAAPPPITADVGYWPTAPEPLNPRPSPSGSPSATPVGQDVPPARPTVSVPGGVTPLPPTRSPSGPALSPGARIGLEPVTYPGYRVRHRNFAGRIDPIGAGSTSQDKADSTFTVRAGLADSRCVSLEAVNYPGYYLRHKDFAIHLHRRDGTGLFAADATFCRVDGLAGRDVSLRSYNYPDRYLYHEWSQLSIARVGDRAAMTFAVRAPV